MIAAGGIRILCAVRAEFAEWVLLTKASISWSEVDSKAVKLSESNDFISCSSML